jgi:prepilin-type N-terminal cleavage/methylation domain-containing protein
MPRSLSSTRGFSLIETVVAIGVLTVGVLGAADVLARGMLILNSSTQDVTVTQKAAEAIEGVFAARDSRKLTWAQIRNVAGASGTDNGIFLDGPQPLRVPGPDSVVNTADDGVIETVILPGPDGLFGTADDITLTLNGYTREIMIRDVPGESGRVRSITVTISYQSSMGPRTYKLVTFISNYA